MDPVLQQAIENKWMFDTKQEAKAAVWEATKKGDLYLLKYGQVTQHAMLFDWCSGVTTSIQAVGQRFQPCVLVFVSRMLDQTVEAANPYGIPLELKATTFVRV